MTTTDIEILLNQHSIKYECSVPLSEKTWIHRGGTAAYYITPIDINELVKVCQWCYDHHRNFKIFGHTSNIYVRKTTNLNYVINTNKLTSYREHLEYFECDCGVHTASLAKYAISMGCSGYEGLVNLPGTIASAIVNNSGCFGCCVSQLLIKAEIMLPDGQIQEWRPLDFAFSERSSIIKEGIKEGVILRVWLRKEQNESPNILLQKAQLNSDYRKTYQEGASANLGSIFPNFVMRAFFHGLPTWQRICIIGISKLCKLVKINSTPYIRDFVICANALHAITPYISRHTLNCFVWKDDGADDAFVLYKQFIQQYSHQTKTEIEIL